MGFSFIGEAKGYNAGSGTDLSCDSTLNIAAGDLIWVAVKWEGTTATPTAYTTDADNNMAMMAISSSAGNTFVAMGYRLVGEIRNPATFNFHLDAARTYRAITVQQFRPDAGDAVTLDQGPSSGTGTSTGVVSSGSIDPNGDDIVVCACCGLYNSVYTENSSDINGVDANGEIWTGAGDSLTGSYSLFTSEQGSMDADFTLSGSTNWVCDICSFKSVAGGGGVIEVQAIG